MKQNTAIRDSDTKVYVHKADVVDFASCLQEPGNALDSEVQVA